MSSSKTNSVSGNSKGDGLKSRENSADIKMNDIDNREYFGIEYDNSKNFYQESNLGTTSSLSPTINLVHAGELNSRSSNRVIYTPQTMTPVSQSRTIYTTSHSSSHMNNSYTTVNSSNSNLNWTNNSNFAKETR